MIKYLSLTIFIILWQFNIASGQQVWPGDVNNNGIVNNVDVLYWAVANGATGAARNNSSTNWEGQELPTPLWEQVFSDSLNYAFADCDGDGDVDDDDKDIIEQNFGLIHGTVTSEDFSTGEISNAAIPILLFNSKDTLLSPGGTLNANLALGSADNPINDFYGIAFTVVYDPDVVGNGGNDFRLNLLEDTWLNGQGDDKVIQFIDNDRENGVAQIAIVRKNQVPVSGFGDIGSFSIVMEDIVFINSSISNTDIRLVDRQLGNTTVAPSTISFSVDTSTTATRQIIAKSGLKIYPNPVQGNQIQLELENQEENIRAIQLFDSNGRLIDQQQFEGLGNQYNFKLSDHPTGIYTFKVITNRFLYVKSFFRQ